MKAEELDELILEYEKDLVSFQDAFDVLEDRAREREESGSKADFVEWPGYLAAKNALIMSIVRLEGLLEDLRTNRERQTVLKLVKGDDDD